MTVLFYYCREANSLQQDLSDVYKFCEVFGLGTAKLLNGTCEVRRLRLQHCLQAVSSLIGALTLLKLDDLAGSCCAEILGRITLPVLVHTKHIHTLQIVSCCVSAEKWASVVSFPGEMLVSLGKQFEYLECFGLNDFEQRTKPMQLTDEEKASASYLGRVRSYMYSFLQSALVADNGALLGSNGTVHYVHDAYIAMLPSLQVNSLKNVWNHVVTKLIVATGREKSGPFVHLCCEALSAMKKRLAVLGEAVRTDNRSVLRSLPSESIDILQKDVLEAVISATAPPPKAGMDR